MGVADGVVVAVGVADGVAVGVADGVVVAVGVADGGVVAVAVVVADGVVVAVGVADGVVVAVAVGVADGVVVAVGVADGVKMISVLHQILGRANFSPRTKEAYARVIEQWLVFTERDPKKWTQRTAQAFYDDMLNRGVTPVSANVYIASLRYVSKWYAVGENKPELDFAIVQQREAPHYHEGGGTKVQRALAEAEVRALLTACAGKTPIDQRDRTMIVVGLETGMRRMSLAGLRLENLSHQNGYPIAKVPIKGAGGHQMFAVPMSSTAMKMITSWRATLRKLGMQEGCAFTGFDKRIGPKGGNVYRPTGVISLPAIYKIIESRAEAAEIKGMHPHMLRHTFITWRQNDGLSAIQIASITGHRTLGAEWANMQPYIDMAMIAEQARESTPPWLAKLVDEIIGVS